MVMIFLQRHHIRAAVYGSGLRLRVTDKSDTVLREEMTVHYSQPKGFVGRSIIYEVLFDGISYGHSVAGSATKHLPGREDFFTAEIGCGTRDKLNNFVNNTFFHISRVEGGYPIRNFASGVIAEWRKRVVQDWYQKYEDEVLGFETLVELPRTGECYLRDGWRNTGTTKGFTCKRVGGKGSDSWGGRRIWDYENLRPKLVFCRTTTP